MVISNKINEYGKTKNTFPIKSMSTGKPKNFWSSKMALESPEALQNNGFGNSNRWEFQSASRDMDLIIKSMSSGKPKNPSSKEEERQFKTVSPLRIEKHGRRDKKDPRDEKNASRFTGERYVTMVKPKAGA